MRKSSFNLIGNDTKSIKSCITFFYDILSEMNMPPYLNEKINEFSQLFSLIGANKNNS
jgi:hypothetical protein